MPRKLTTEEFVDRARKIHGDKYDYSKVEYINTKKKVCIICPEHGEFWMKPNDHLSRKYGCHKCGWIEEGKNARKTVDEFIREAREKYGDVYDYSKVVYEKNNKKVCIISHETDAYGVEIGEFWQTPANHIAYGYSGDMVPVTTERFIARAKKIHGDLYSYNKTIFNNSKTKVIISCPIHGDFEQLPHLHLRGEGCPKCKNKSVLEKRVRNLLVELDVKFIEQKRFDFLGKQSVDFFIPDINVAIECQGRQHFIKSSLWEEFEVLLQRDRKKKKLCNDNGIKVIYVINKKYKDMDTELYQEDNTFNVKNLKSVINQIVKKEPEK